VKSLVGLTLKQNGASEKGHLRIRTAKRAAHARLCAVARQGCVENLRDMFVIVARSCMPLPMREWHLGVVERQLRQFGILTLDVVPDQEKAGSQPRAQLPHGHCPYYAATAESKALAWAPSILAASTRAT
jgi:hypothetical protein